MSASASLLRPGENCWQKATAKDAAFVVDAAGYFAAVSEALQQAQRSVWILGWDIHSRLALVREEGGAKPERPLGALLDHIARERPDLEVRILCWDFAVLYALEREAFPVFRFGWSTHPRVRFELDSEHPLGASHHQKIVVVDGELAFVGGIDLTTHRWDTPSHAPEDARRVTPAGEPFAPFHDVQVALTGPAARVVEELARERWLRATGEEVPACPAEARVWPEGLRVELRDVEVGIARTEPAYEDREEVREVERAYLDAIAHAERHIYVENQYLSASCIGEALAERLAEPDGPEVLFVGQVRCTGWLEEATMGVMRARLLRRLAEADVHGRLRAVYPVVSRAQDATVNVHAKVMIVDDTMARVGSSNLSNRSMGLDTECDAILMASTPEHRRAIRGFRTRLLAEHLGVSAEAVDERLDSEDSLVALVDAFAGEDRGVEPISTDLEPWIDDLVPDEQVVDPETAIGADELASRLLHEEGADPSDGHPIRRAVAVLTGLVVLALFWRFGPLSEWLAPERVAAALAPWYSHPLGPVFLVGAFALASLLMVPVTVLIVGCSLLYGAEVGGLFALAGAIVSSAAAYGIGHFLWRDAVRTLGGKGLNRLSRMLARRGIMAMAAVRIVPVAPFTVVNLVAGASHIRFRDFMAGTVLAMGPGIFAMAWLSDRIAELVRDPAPVTLLGAVGALLLVSGAVVLVRRRFARYGIGPND